MSGISSLGASETAFRGRLSTALTDYTPRTAQIDMAQAIEDAIEEGGNLVVEAGTGTGKTYAYLVPCLVLGKKTIVATGTKTLQDQLFHQDLPILIAALGLSSRIQMLKGRANYLCRQRIDFNEKQGSFSSLDMAQEFKQIHKKLPQVQRGEVNEFPDIPDDSPIWPFVTSTTENCLGSECAFFEDCFLVKARRKALKADVLVINHHLFFADSLLKEEGFGELLPGADVIVFDEAHQLPEIAANFYGVRVSSRQLLELMHDTAQVAQTDAKDMQALVDVPASIIHSIEKFRQLLEHKDSKRAWFEVIRDKRVGEAFTFFQLALKELSNVLALAAPRSKELARCHERCIDFILQLKQFEANQDDCIQWLEIFKSSFVLHVTPGSVADSFSHCLSQNEATHVFTSATLTVDKQFEHFTQPLGITSAATLILDSPFNYQQQALLYAPRGMPDTKADNYIEILLLRVMPLIELLQGRSFLLFTSYKALHLAADILKQDARFTLLIQGEEANHLLLKRFKQSSNALLLGTASFWEGVDVKGESLSCVVIDKLPFASPFDPVTKAKIESFRKKGLSAFDEYQVPQAVVALKQGVGRLIRGVDDKGIMVINDPRLVARAYGQRFLNSLPSMTLTRNEDIVLEFADNLRLNNEKDISN